MTSLMTNEQTSQNPVPDRVLAEKLRRGDPESYETLVREYGRRMMAVARHLLRDEEEARDVLQESFLNVFRSAGKFRGEAAISTWLHRIVVNTALMKLRAARRRPATNPHDRVSFENELEPAAQPVESGFSSAESKLLQEERRAIVRQSIAQLPGNYREVLRLRDLEELDTAETARQLGITENAVKLRLHRGRQALAPILRGSLAGGGAEHQRRARRSEGAFACH